MPNKTVIITGAGFSYPANLPIQSRIISEMIKKPEIGFLSDWDLETVKFYKAYIEVGIFLIENYTKCDGNRFRQKMKTIFDEDTRIKIEQSFIKNLYANKSVVKEIEATKHIQKKFSERISPSKAILDSNLIKRMAGLKEEIRSTLESENVQVDLEDLFTKLDKCVQTQNYWKHYSYLRVIEIKQYLLQLFVYYFGKKNKEFIIDDYYRAFAVFVKENKPSIVTTNWDTICEQIFSTEHIVPDMCLSDNAYYSSGKKVAKPKIAKIHGSIGWFSCANCGSLIRKSKGEEAEFLLGDKKMRCSRCKITQQDNLLFTPEIITPTMVKSFSKQVYVNVWQNAEYILKDADEIIFVGYSMPLADFEFRYLLTKHISSKAEIHVVLCEADKKGEQERREVPEDRYRVAFPKNKLSFYYDGFSAYFDKKIESI